MKIQIPFRDVHPGEMYESLHTKRHIVGLKRALIEVGKNFSDGGRVPFRNAVIVNVFDTGTDSIGKHIFESDNDISVTVDRP